LVGNISSYFRGFLNKSQSVKIDPLKEKNGKLLEKMENEHMKRIILDSNLIKNTDNEPISPISPGIYNIKSDESPRI
jgi:hypothetical protein